MKKILSVALLAILLPALAMAQFSISGKITDPSNQPLAGANVKIEHTYLSTSTDAAGEFTLKGLKKGIYRVLVSYVGYQETDRVISLSSDDVIDLTLRPSTFLADEVIVKATRAARNTATTYRNLTRAELDKQNLGQDLPYLLSQTPSVVVTSDAGAGVGYTGLRIRGSDPTRINVTVNGIPYNDAESQGTFFVDLPDFASSVDNIQIQRGVGTSTNGAGAFGASLNIQTTTRRDTAYADLNNSFGSYNTWKNTVSLGTGLIDGKFSIDGRLSRIASNGYIDRASSNLRSYFISGAYYGKKSLLRANVFSGAEKTYQAWNGVPQNLLATNRTYNEFTYPDQTDNYNQDHYQLLYSHSFSSRLSFNGALHYTHGKGYYEEYKTDQQFQDYGMQPLQIGDSTVASTNLVRRRWLDNDFYGLTYSLNYTPSSKLNFTLGGGYNEYNGDHFGQVTWAQYASNSTNSGHYYDDNGFKTDFNVFGKASYQLGALNLYGDLQYRRVGYSFAGLNRNLQDIRQRDKLNFFNPKIGASYQLTPASNIYASLAVANREPNRDDYTESTPEVPKPENLKDLELGYRLEATRFSGSLNGYYMRYKDQLVVTGQINDVGGYLRTNVPDSYRVGLELDAKWQIRKDLSWAVTGTLSRNRIKNFAEYIYNYDDDSQQRVDYKSTDIAFSPALIASSDLSVRPFPKTELSLISKYVGMQYLDNTANDNRKIDSYFVNDLRLRYNTPFRRMKNLGVTLLVSNIFNEYYEANGYTFSYISSGSLATENYYFPQATRNFLLSLNLSF